MAEPPDRQRHNRVCHCGAPCAVRASRAEGSAGLLYFACGLRQGPRACSLKKGFLGWVGQAPPEDVPGDVPVTAATYLPYAEELPGDATLTTEVGLIIQPTIVLVEEVSREILDRTARTA